MKKRIYPLLLLLCLLVTSISASPQAICAQGTAKTTKYAAFGDSIAAGYGLTGYSDGQTAAPADSYQALLAEFLHTKSCNYAVSGNNSDDCINLLNSGKADADLAEADIITISIGSNDLLLPFIQIVKDHFHINSQDATLPLGEGQAIDGLTLPQSGIAGITAMMEYLRHTEALLAELSDNATLHAQAAAFPEKFKTILSLLHEKAPQAEIYATNVYNPFAFLPMLGELSEIYIKEINQAFSADASDYYTLVDVYTPFQEKELTNVHFDVRQPTTICLDPHPSTSGHAAIGELMVAALKEAHTPKAAVLKSVSSTSKKKLTVKVQLPADADGYEVQYAASKNGNYQSLGTATAKTFQTNSKKLKPGKAYYVKACSYKEIKGVTYYGKDSDIKKITIK